MCAPFFGVLHTILNYFKMYAQVFYTFDLDTPICCTDNLFDIQLANVKCTCKSIYWFMKPLMQICARREHFYVVSELCNQIKHIRVVHQLKPHVCKCTMRAVRGFRVFLDTLHDIPARSNYLFWQSGCRPISVWCLRVRVPKVHAEITISERCSDRNTYK